MEYRIITHIDRDIPAFFYYSAVGNVSACCETAVKINDISNVYIFQIIRGYRSDKNFLSISDFYYFSVLLLHFKTGMGGYCVIEIFVKYYVTSAVTPAANVNSYAYCRWMTCGVLDIYAHD